MFQDRPHSQVVVLLILMPSSLNQSRFLSSQTVEASAMEESPNHHRPVHWRESVIEALLLGLFMVSACSITSLLQLPSSPLRRVIPDALLRRAVIGVCMGLTATALIYSPWGQRSGAHMNPSVTLTFYRLGKIRWPDAALYIVGQFVGGVCGVLLSGVALRGILARPEIGFVATHPGAAGPWVALVAEFLISFLMMWMVLRVSNDASLSRYTGWFAGLLVATYIAFEAPYSGMSMNPARSFASAVPSSLWTDLWIYLIAPPLGMLAGAEVYVRLRSDSPVMCCKLYHNPRKRCTFCGLNGDIHE
jgi:aquaporin Z